MKVNKLNPSHYLYYFLILVSFAFGFLLSIFKKRNPSVICTAPKINSNISLIFEALDQQNIKSFYLCISYKEYKALKANYKNILCVIYPTHWYKVFNSKLIISSHSIIFHTFINIFTTIYTIHSGHGIRTGSLKNNQKQFKRIYYKFDEMWLISDLEKDIYNEMGYAKNNQIVIGYPVIEKISKYKKQNKKTKSYLIAPTSYEFKNNIKSKFDIENEKFLAFLESIAVKNDSKIVIKPHWKTKLETSIVKFISSSKYLELASLSKPVDYIQLLANSDVLITDWSGIYVDFLALQKPIVFLNNLPPRDVPSFTKAIENNIINRIKSLEELEAEIINQIYSTNINDLKDFVFGKQNYDNVLEEIVNKAKEVIAK